MNILVLLILLFGGAAVATPRGEISRGNTSARAGDLDQALVHYKQALQQRGDTAVALYNVGNVLHENQQHDAAVKAYMGALNAISASDDQAEIFYNLGNSHFSQQKYDEAIKSYIQALLRSPDDDEARYNLELAQRLLQLQQQQSQQPSEQAHDSQQGRQDADQNQPPHQNAGQDKREGEQPTEDEHQDPQPLGEDQSNRGQATADLQMTKEQAERILNALLQNEQDALKQVKAPRTQSRSKKEKDW